MPCHDVLVIHILGLIYLKMIKHHNKGSKAYFAMSNLIDSVKDRQGGLGAYLGMLVDI